jgi:hypothetical protein
MKHLTNEDLVAYFAGDHPDENVVEEHLFACAECTREGERTAAITETIRAMIPVVIDHAALARLQGRGVRVLENAVAPEVQSHIVFPTDVDLVVHRLQGLDLKDASRVDVRVYSESTRKELAHVPAAPFDRDAGEIMIACQRHFSVMPPDTVMEVVVRSPRGETTRRYPIMHDFTRA